MRLSWNEIRTRVATFAEDWAGKGYEKGETQLFYQEFLMSSAYQSAALPASNNR